jgi:hypothetical protein
MENAISINLSRKLDFLEIYLKFQKSGLLGMS